MFLWLFMCLSIFFDVFDKNNIMFLWCFFFKVISLVLVDEFKVIYILYKIRLRRLKRFSY